MKKSRLSKEKKAKLIEYFVLGSTAGSVASACQLVLAWYSSAKKG